ncbi:MAG: 4Fe-4S dicluster domain-containing protein [Desulfovibrionaceae bacterium]
MTYKDAGMFGIIKERLHQKFRTLDYPFAQPALSPRYLGRPRIAGGACPDGCTACRDACPTGAIALQAERCQEGIALDMGRCLFCGACAQACPRKAITFTQEHRVASPTRDGLIITPQSPTDVPADRSPGRDLSLFARSLKFRQVSAGGCGACEADCNVLGTLVYDMGHFGLDFVASPRHADGLVVTGPVTENMRAALLDTYAAVPEPRVVIAAGSCAISGGLFAREQECHDGVDSFLPVDIYIPGCPPNPWSILDGMLSVAWLKARQK